METVTTMLLPPRSALGLAVRVWLLASVLVALPAAVAIAFSVQQNAVLAGVAAILLLGAPVTLVHARAVLQSARSPGAGGTFQVALAAGFVIQLLGIGVTLLLLHGMEMKFDWLTSFGIAFAGATLIFGLVAAAAMVRHLQRRSPPVNLDDSSSPCRV